MFDQRPTQRPELGSQASSSSFGQRQLADLDDDALFDEVAAHDLDGDEPDFDDGFVRNLGASPRAEELAAPAPKPKATPVARKPKAVGGNDALGRKENKLLQWKEEMVEVAEAMAAQFEPLGLHFRPQILLATALQEADAKDPLNAISFDKGLGIMQITPYKGKLDPAVAKAIGWDNSKSVNENIKTSKWRDAKANLMAGAQTMLAKAKALRRMVPAVWAKMDETQRWRAVLYAYNAGESNASKALRAGGPNARMISTFVDKKGRRVSHDYTKELQEKLDYVEEHDPFDGDAAPDKPDKAPEPTPGGAPEPGGKEPSGDAQRLSASVGRGGENRKPDVTAVQDRLKDRGVSPGPIDGLVGPKTVGAIETFQQATIHMADGLITPGKNTEKHLFGGSGKVDGKAPEPQGEKDKAVDPDKGSKEPTEEKDHPSWAAIAANFNAKISGTAFSWHEAFWLPSFNRHVRPSDVTNISIDTLIANVERQAAALTEVRNAIGKAIVVHCWVRPPAYNKHIGGASNSAHLRGMATDFHCPGMTAEQVRQAVKSRKLYPGAGENNVSWVHLDLEHTRWFNP